MSGRPPLGCCYVLHQKNLGEAATAQQAHLATVENRGEWVDNKH